MPIMDNKNTFLILSMKHEEMAIRADRGLTPESFLVLE